MERCVLSEYPDTVPDNRPKEQARGILLDENVLVKDRKKLWVQVGARDGNCLARPKWFSVEHVASNPVHYSVVREDPPFLKKRCSSVFRRDKAVAPPPGP